MAVGCTFCEIVRGERNVKRVYENRSLLAFHDRHPVAPTHVLIVPKRHVESLMAGKADERFARTCARLLLAARHIAHELGLHHTGFRVVINSGDDAGQAVPHLHAHLLAGRAFEWPPG